MGEELKSDFRNLQVWQKCRDIRIIIWKLCKEFPSEERFRLSDQMIRSSRSSTSNIAEGYGLFHFQENIQFCRQSRGSLFELMDHVLVAEECEYIDEKRNADGPYYFCHSTSEQLHQILENQKSRDFIWLTMRRLKKA